ncbi:MAG: histidine--tRNA ligase [Proteobacteria bacterium]|nr:histidine--tRNA ligase [Pseudomonadota bacterium]MBU1716591.1 histidine--tRNA ligase [Pseudomonadota bacterium]
MSIKALKGFKDILPTEVHTWQRIEKVARDIFHRFEFSEIKVPILEKTKLFSRSIGEATDIVEKEMYTFTDRNGSSITMRPEGTASVLRAFIEHSLHALQPIQKLYTIGPMFRHERPQKGRLRQFHQISVEVLGTDLPRQDAELIAMAWLLLTELRLTVSLEINSLGCPACRPEFNQALIDFLASCEGPLCEDCQRRRQTNPLRVLDCKDENCQEQYKAAPSIIDHLCPACTDHFQAVQDGLTLLEIPYKSNSRMVRGLDYYTRTTFELVTDALGAQSAVGAGGRYDGLVGQLDGPKDMPGIGFAMGIERLVLLLEQQTETSEPQGIDIFVVSLGTAAADLAFKIVHTLRKSGVQATMDLAGRSMKNQMKQAGRNNARYTLIIGEDELTKGQLVLRDMQTREQEEIAFTDEITPWSKALAAKLLNK